MNDSLTRQAEDIAVVGKLHVSASPEALRDHSTHCTTEKLNIHGRTKAEVLHTRISSSSITKSPSRDAIAIPQDSPTANRPMLLTTSANQSTPSVVRLTSNVSALRLQDNSTTSSSFENHTNMRRTLRSPHSQDKFSSMEASPVRAHGKQGHEGKRFSIKDFLVSLGCIPVKAGHENRLTSSRSPSDNAQNVPSKAPIPLVTTQEKKVPRKAVDFRPTAQITLENRIKQDRADIERIVSAQRIDDVDNELVPAIADDSLAANVPPSNITVALPQRDMVGCVRSDLQPYRDSSFVRHCMVDEQRRSYFLTRYANPIDYPHKATKAQKKLEEVIISIVNASLTANFNPTEAQLREYIYVFRLDGDYAYTPNISLKIGRSKDVDARLRQWYAQCRYKIDKLDQFQTGHAILLERMLHLEFEEDRVLKQCRCGRTHREWFDVRRDDAKGRIKRAYLKWSSFADEVHALRTR